MKERVSVIIAAYKADWCLERCLASIFAQTRKPDEILIGVDGCRPTLMKVESIVKRSLPVPIRHFYFSPNVGPYVVRTTLACLARNDILALFDADDEMHENYVEAMGEICEPGRYARPRYVNHLKTGKTIEGNFPADGCIMVYKRDVLRLRGWEPWRAAADSDFRKRAEVAGIEWKASGDPLMKRHLHDDNLTVASETGMNSEYRLNKKKIIECRKKEKYEKKDMHIAKFGDGIGDTLDADIITVAPKGEAESAVWEYCGKWWERVFQVNPENIIKLHADLPRAIVINRAAKISKAEILVVTDPDVIPEVERMDEAINAIKGGKADFATPHQFISLKPFFIGRCEGFSQIEEVGVAYSPEPSSPMNGIMVCNRRAFLSVGGFNESLENLHAENLDLFSRLPSYWINKGVSSRLVTPNVSISGGNDAYSVIIKTAAAGDESTPPRTPPPKRSAKPAIQPKKNEKKPPTGITPAQIKWWRKARPLRPHNESM